MILSDVFERFSQNSPLSVMAHGSGQAIRAHRVKQSGSTWAIST